MQLKKRRIIIIRESFALAPHAARSNWHAPLACARAVLRAAHAHPFTRTRAHRHSTAQSRFYMKRKMPHS